MCTNIYWSQASRDDEEQTSNQSTSTAEAEGTAGAAVSEPPKKRKKKQKTPKTMTQSTLPFAVGEPRANVVSVNSDLKWYCCQVSIIKVKVIWALWYRMTARVDRLFLNIFISFHSLHVVVSGRAVVSDPQIHWISVRNDCGWRNEVQIRVWRLRKDSVWTGYQRQHIQYYG